ncbi:MAG TPA: transcriptional regulator NrdR [Thermotogota bacterium]|nr:transcriptional repressor NrdR [Thermotogota bacterium]MDD8041446.1 transcriptional regulator NrdR [Thermotogota bacterium]HNR63009.1 transcriptional regulator NrdR [Thermotogota bacterium]HNT95159.1 transcriptional regulator NrdR [Thermotogota bacterium]HOZ11379.1 transcriptional regulator NrdR [Thermotogota bacterium]
MKCPFCSYEDTKVADSRPAEENRAVRRRRVCPACSARFTTYERYEMQPVVVIKRDGRRERFKREKILNGLIRSCEKRNISEEQLNALVSEVELQIQRSDQTEIKSTQIGEWVMEALKKLDNVAYVRFASVYKDFRDIDQFRHIIDELRKGGT